MWKKLLTPTLIITLVTLFALTWYCSIKAEEYFSLWVERSNDYAPAMTTNELVSYDRRFFTASAITRVDIKNLGRYDFHHLIRHYAWGGTIITTPLTVPDAPSSLAGLRIVTDVGPTGTARSRLSLPQLTVATDSGTKVVIDRIAGEAQVNAAATEGSWDISLEQIQVAGDENSRLIIAGINSSGAMENLDQFPLGHSRTRINSLALETAEGRPFVINGLTIDGTNLFDRADYYVTRSDISLASIQVGDSAFTDSRLVLALNNLDSLVIEALITARNTLRRHINANTGSGDELAEEIILPLYHALVQSGATLALENLALATAGGQLSGTGHATLKSGTTAPGLDELLEQIILELQLDFDVVILARLNQLAEQIQGKTTNISLKEEELRMIFGGLAQLGFLTRLEGDRFRLRVAYDDGAIKLNDQPFRLF
jgi:uncharacterized protein YdgA (DUF945 family)